MSADPVNDATAPVDGTTNDGAFMQHEAQEAPDDTQAPPALVDDLKTKYRFDSKTRRGQELTKYEGIIERSLYTFIEVGTALAAIRDKHLYREYLDGREFKTFKEYCENRWKFSDSRARQYIDAAAVATVTAVTELLALPSERVARAFVPLKKDKKKLKAAAEGVKSRIDKGEAFTHKLADEEAGKVLGRAKPPPSNGKPPAANPVAPKAPIEPVASNAPQSAPIAEPATVGTAPVDPPVPAKESKEDKRIDTMFFTAMKFCDELEVHFPEPNKGEFIRKYLSEVHGFNRAKVEKAIDFFMTLRQIGDDVKWFAPVAS